MALTSAMGTLTRWRCCVGRCLCSRYLPGVPPAPSWECSGSMGGRTPQQGDCVPVSSPSSANTLFLSRAGGSGGSGTTGCWTTTPCPLDTSGGASLGTSMLPTRGMTGGSSSLKVSTDAGWEGCGGSKTPVPPTKLLRAGWLHPILTHLPHQSCCVIPRGRGSHRHLPLSLSIGAPATAAEQDLLIPILQLFPL